MTPAELQERGLRVRELKWDHVSSVFSVADGVNSTHQIRGGTDGIWRWQCRYMAEWVGFPTQTEAIAAANTHHAAQVAGMIERIE